MDPASLGARITEARKSAGLSSAGLADRVGCRPLTVWRWQKGHHKPDADSLKRIAEACGVSVDWLLSDVVSAPTLPPTG